MANRPRLRRSQLTIALGATAASIISVALPTAATATTAASATELASFALDGTTLTASAPNLPDVSPQTSEAGSPMQEAVFDRRYSTYKVTITAVPVGAADPLDFPDLGPHKAGDIGTWSASLRRQRDAQGGASHAGPVASLFGHTVVGIASTPMVAIDGVHPERADLVEWVTEAGNRAYVIQAFKRASEPIADFASGVRVSGTHLDAATSIGHVTPASEKLAETNAAAARARTPATTATSSSSALSSLSEPSWWNGKTCDSGNSASYQLGSSNVRGIIACGPTPAYPDYAKDVRDMSGFPISWNEWECTELAGRYMYEAGYISNSYQASGGQIVENYRGSKLTKVTNGQANNVSPAPGDVISMATNGADGHVALVLANNVNSSGNGSITLLQQNFSENGLGTMSVSGGMVASEEPGNTGYGYVNGVAWLHDPADGVKTPPSDFNVTIDANGAAATGQNVSSTVNLTAMASSQGYINTLSYTITGPGGYSTTINGGSGSTNYAQGWNTAGLASGRYSISVTANETDGNNHTYGPGTVNVNNAPAAPSVGITSPAPGAYVSGTVALAANAADSTTGAGISVQYQVDGANVGGPATGAPYPVPLDTTALTVGSHTLTAIATASVNGASSPSVTSAPVTFNVAGSVAQLHKDGTIFIHSGAANTNWSQIGTNSASKEIATSNGGADLYELDNTGAIWKWTNSSGWSSAPIGNNVAAVHIAASQNALYELDNTGAIWKWTQASGWTSAPIGNNVAAKAIAAGNDNSLYELDSTGTVWQYNEATIAGNHWLELDNNTGTVGMAAGDAPNSVWELHNDGSIWQYTGTPMTGWTQVGNNVAATRIVAGPQAGVVYELDTTGTIYEYNNGTWSQPLDTNPLATSIQVGDDGTLYQLHSNGEIYQYTPGINNNWTLLDNNTAATAISSGATRSAHL
ncbi:Ig-like domain-containing protein [Catenulispora pinisilvae]|uniref:Ig-like domain-containing protein n=1 Tax=Catenulispora pinisilvae TaxID=2705253 RepID=UPI001890EF8B|nr:Ig-like domain-containing protein [Catenulispora pinisilvae]